MDLSALSQNIKLSGLEQNYDTLNYLTKFKSMRNPLQNYFRNQINIQNMATIIEVQPTLFGRPGTLQRYTSMKTLIPATSPEPKQTLKRVENYVYNTKDLIGEGYSSKVYKTKKDGSSEIMAMKVITLKKQSSSNLQMLQDQINILRQISHQNVIKCYDIFITQQNCFIATQYCEGGDLYSQLKKNKLTADDKHTVIRDILRGYSHLAEHEIIHRDIKPANIFLKEGVWKLADFGFSKKASSLKSREHVNVGTPLYMPPEALLYNKYSVKTDIFAMGVLFYELLFGVSPWHSRTQKELISKMTKQPLVIPPNATPEFKQLLEGCLSIDSFKRFTFQEMMSTEFSSGLFNNPESPCHRTLKASKSTGASLCEELQKSNCNRNKKNTQIYINQINLCRFMFYIYKNRSYLCANNMQRNRLSIILLRHMTTLINRIVDSKNSNCFNLQDFDVYKSCSQFQKITKTSEQYKARYQKQFQDFKLSLQGDELTELNRSLNFFTIYENRAVDKTFYSLINSFIKLHLKQACLQMSSQVKKLETESLRCKIQFIRNLYNYSILLEIMIKNMDDYELFASVSHIEINIDYNKNRCTINTFNELKDKIKALVI